MGSETMQQSYDLAADERRAPRRVQHNARDNADGTLRLLGQRWMLHIIRDVCSGYTRFNQMQANLGISRALLTARLRELVAEGIVEVAPAPGSTRRSHYVPTARGLALYRVILLMQEWGWNAKVVKLNAS